MALLLKPGMEPAEAWLPVLADLMPDLEVRVWPDWGDPDDIEVAVITRPPPGVLKQFRNLRFIASIPAGVDMILSDPELPDVPIVRNVNPRRSASMAEYALTQVMMHHRQMPLYLRQQGERVWTRSPQGIAADRSVGVMGMGELGGAAARLIAGVGFSVAGWSRRPKSEPGVISYAGDGALDAFLARTEILVCLLPLTDATRGILNAALLAKLPRGAVLINAARGDHVVEADLLAALDSGHIGGASLDVFQTEPLPADNPLWTHPKVIVTPHIASIGKATASAPIIIENLKRARAGLPLDNLVDRSAGY